MNGFAAKAQKKGFSMDELNAYDLEDNLDWDETVDSEACANCESPNTTTETRLRYAATLYQPAEYWAKITCNVCGYEDIE